MSEVTLFQVLDQLNQHNTTITHALTESEQKKFAPLVLMKWMFYSGVAPITLQRVNANFFQHTGPMQLSLLGTAGGAPKHPRWKWIKSSGGKAQQSEVLIDAVMNEYHINRSTALSVLDLFSEADASELLDAHK
jgi:hypothetical protein